MTRQVGTSKVCRIGIKNKTGNKLEARRASTANQKNLTVWLGAGEAGQFK